MLAKNESQSNHLLKLNSSFTIFFTIMLTAFACVSPEKSSTSTQSGALIPKANEQENSLSAHADENGQNTPESRVYEGPKDPLVIFENQLLKSKNNETVFDQLDRETLEWITNTPADPDLEKANKQLVTAATIMLVARLSLDPERQLISGQIRESDLRTQPESNSTNMAPETGSTSATPEAHDKHPVEANASETAPLNRDTLADQGVEQQPPPNAGNSSDMAEAPPIEQATQSPPKHFAQLLEEYDIDLPDALTNNLFMGHPKVLLVVIEATELAISIDTISTSEHLSQIIEVLKKRIETMDSYISSLQDASIYSKSKTLPNSNQVNQQITLADYREIDEFLIIAQVLADRGDYEAAINFLNGTPVNIHSRPIIERRKTTLSSIAVQDLRRNAARAFQNARPDSNLKTKAGYLEEAKKYLTKAIELYPNAPQIPTVTNNLRVLEKTLEELYEQIDE